MDASVTVVNDGDFVELIALDADPREGRVRMVFAEDVGPVTLKVKNPAGAVVLDRVLRELPTRGGSSCAPVSVPISQPGDYAIEVRPLSGLAHRAPTRDPWELCDKLRRFTPASNVAGVTLLRVA